MHQTWLLVNIGIALLCYTVDSEFSIDLYSPGVAFIAQGIREIAAVPVK